MGKNWLFSFSMLKLKPMNVPHDNNKKIADDFYFLIFFLFVFIIIPILAWFQTISPWKWADSPFWSNLNVVCCWILAKQQLFPLIVITFFLALKRFDFIDEIPKCFWSFLPFVILLLFNGGILINYKRLWMDFFMSFKLIERAWSGDIFFLHFVFSIKAYRLEQHQIIFHLDLFWTLCHY